MIRTKSGHLLNPCPLCGKLKDSRSEMCIVCRNRQPRMIRHNGQLRPRFTLAERFWAKVDKSGDCWIWTGNRHKAKGRDYGMINTRDGSKLAHRVSYELHYGPIPPGMEVCHRCDNPPCVNPAHLFLGTHSDNMRDCVNKQRKNAVRGSKHKLSKLTDAQVEQIRQSPLASAELARQFGVSDTLVCNIRKGKAWKHV